MDGERLNDIPPCSPKLSREAEREPDWSPNLLTGSRNSFHPFAATMGVESGREPGSTLESPHDVRSGEQLERPGSRVRYTVERGSGSSGTAYNKFDWIILDRQGPPGRQLVCRTDQGGARLIAYALNQALPR